MAHDNPWSVVVDEDHSVALVLSGDVITAVGNEFNNSTEVKLSRDQAVDMLKGLRTLLKMEAPVVNSGAGI